MAPGSRLQELTAKYMQNPRRYFVPLANEYRKSNELDRAIALCREHLPAQPGHLSGHIVLARAYFEKGDIEAAREVFLTSVDLDDENLIALRHLGDIARLRHDLTEARQWYARVLDADPQNDEIERILRSLGEPGAPTAVEGAPVAATAAEAPVPEFTAEPASSTSGLFDPTPPGLRAIVAADGPVGTAPAATPHELPPVPSRPLDTFDLTTLDALPNHDDVGSGIAVDDGVGFIFDDLDELVDPATTAASGLSLPPVNEADFSAGIETPTSATPSVDDDLADPLLSRPGFGALASFASWRTAQDRDTPSQQPAQPATPAVSQPVVSPPADADDDAGLFWTPGTTETASTAPEFVTETMAALYLQQGFTLQALEVYRALLARTPSDRALHAKVAELESVVHAATSDTSLEEDADKALQFDDFDGATGDRSSSASMLEEMYDVSPPTVDAGADAPAFGGGWTPDSDRAADADDDWFADAATVDPSTDGGTGFDGFFGVSTDGFGQPIVPALGREGGATSRAAVPLEAVFGSALVASSDEAAADILLALAGQMVGRLPKEPPTLPVPDILELPSAVPGDEATGASPAPLLSFDRFFSGSGSPPRQRIDTPSVSRTTTPSWPTSPAPAAPPSLSPTFGGVPVVPPPPASVTPSSWATFDQFVPPVSVPPTAPPAAPLLPAAPPVAAPTPVRVPTPSFFVDLAPVSPVVPPASPSVPPPEPGIPPAPQAEPAQKPAPSDFHRWLEGLS